MLNDKVDALTALVDGLHGYLKSPAARIPWHGVHELLRDPIPFYAKVEKPPPDPDVWRERGWEVFRQYAPTRPDLRTTYGLAPAGDHLNPVQVIDPRPSPLTDNYSLFNTPPPMVQCVREPVTAADYR